MIVTERVGSVLEIVLDRPEARNALTYGMNEELDALFDGADRDDAVRAIVLRGNGPVFCAGRDLNEMAARRQAGGPEEPSPPKGMPRAWYLSKPLIGAAQGYVGAHGMSMLALCDFVIAAEGTRFSYDLMRSGGSAPYGSHLLLHFLVPARVMRKFWLMGGWMDAAEALSFQFVQRVVPLDDLVTETRRWAEQVALVPARHLAAAKDALRRDYEAMGLSGMVDGTDRATGHGNERDAEFFANVGSGALSGAVQRRNAGFDEVVGRV